MYKPLFLVQLRTDTPLSEVLVPGSFWGEHQWSVCCDYHLRLFSDCHHSSCCLGDHAFQQTQEGPAGPEYIQYYAHLPTTSPEHPQHPP